MIIDINKIRDDFPILKTEYNGKKLIYLDTAASSQKPRQVLDAIENYYLTANANVHRGAHELGERATLAYEKARAKAANFIQAKHSFETIFTKNATEALNLAANIICAGLKSGDEILLSKMAHHSNIVPWMMMAERYNLTLKWVELTEDYRLDIADLRAKLSERTKVVAVSYISNALGVINPVKEICALAKRAGALTVIDACQAAPHLEIDVQDLACDFLAFSAHKMLGPMGIGVLYGKREHLESMPPFLGGGDMIQEVFLDHFTCADLPNKYEAGTPNVAGAVGLMAAIEYLEELGFENLTKHEQFLTSKILEGLKSLPFVKIIGPETTEDRIAVVSFTIDGVHPHDVGEFLNDKGVAIRTGHHCAQPLMDHLGLAATSRVSAYLYNTEEEIDAFLKAVEGCHGFFA